jgi:hypothetical protein
MYTNSILTIDFVNKTKLKNKNKNMMYIIFKFIRESIIILINYSF